LAVLGMAVFLATALDGGLSVEADAEGFFVGADGAAAGDVFPGAGVIAAFFDGTRGRIVGRLDPKAPSPTAWTRSADGSLVARPLRVAVAGASQRGAFVAAALAALSRLPESGTTTTFAECCGATAESSGVAPPGDAPPPSSTRRPIPEPTPGDPLDAWAPRDDLYVRFRSVEAAYRFCRAADELAAALLVSESEDARDYGTLRLVLHDLLLPTIWRANPESERGVSEVGIVVAPPFVRGRLAAAALFRVVDPELHRMQTTAGVAMEARPDHLWTPRDDPFPAERTRINFRTIPKGAPDLEIVATDRALCERIASRAPAPMSDVEEYRDVRGATTTADGRAADDEAVFAFCPYAADEKRRALVPGLVRGAVRSMREATGLRALAERWLERPRSSQRPDPHVRGPSLLASVEAVRVTTDARGAAVWAKCVDAESAGRFAQALRGLASAGGAADRACLRNLADLAPLALVEGAEDDPAERNFVVLGWKPVCPCGGTYSVHPVTREPVCSAHGSAASPKKAAWTPPTLSEVASREAELSFRLAIDWNRRE
jgi:hypothetical protein